MRISAREACVKPYLRTRSDMKYSTLPRIGPGRGRGKGKRALRRQNRPALVRRLLSRKNVVFHNECGVPQAF